MTPLSAADSLTGLTGVSSWPSSCERRSRGGYAYASLKGSSVDLAVETVVVVVVVTLTLRSRWDSSYRGGTSV